MSLWKFGNLPDDNKEKEKERKKNFEEIPDDQETSAAGSL